MKHLNLLKSFLLLCALVVGSSSVWAESWTWTATTVNDLGSTSTSGGSSATVTLNGKSWTSIRKLISGSTYTGTSLLSGCIQLGKNGGVDNVSLKTSAFDGNIIKKVSVECSSYNNAHKCSIKVGDAVYKSATATAKWTTIGTIEGTGTAQGEIDIEFTDGTRALYIKSITVEYETASSVEKPTFSPEGGVIYEATTVTMSAEEGCTIYYTTDGENPTTSSASGTSVIIPASGTTTLKAIAVDGSNNSSAVATAVYIYKDLSALYETKEGFSSTSGKLETIIGYEAFKGGAGTAPGNYNDGIRLYQKSGSYSYGGYITLTAPEGYMITGFSITSNDTYSTTVDYTVDGRTNVGTGESLAASGEYSKDGLFNSSVSIFNLGSGSDGRLEIGKITVYYKVVSPVTISSAGYATFCSTRALDFSDVDDVTAYTASLSGSTVTFNKVTGSVPAGTGLLLKGAADTYNIPVVASSTTDVSGNKLVGVTAATVIDGTSGNFFVLKKVGENVGFYKVNNATYTVRANTAYLNAEGAGAKDFIGFDDDETTAIDNLTISQFVKNAPVYNLAGQKVSNSYKGIVIVNGKKYINK